MNAASCSQALGQIMIVLRASSGPACLLEAISFSKSVPSGPHLNFFPSSLPLSRTERETCACVRTWGVGRSVAATGEPYDSLTSEVLFLGKSHRCGDMTRAKRGERMTSISLFQLVRLVM